MNFKTKIAPLQSL